MMKSSQKTTRIQLDVKSNDRFFIYGLVSADPDYKLSLALNKKMGISLKNSTPLQLPDSSGTEQTFSRFSYINHSDDITFSLISNRSGRQFLLKNLKNIDYIFQVHYPECDNLNLNISSILKDTESVNAVFLIDTETFTDKNLQYIIQ
jgi:hypothetical protein